MTSFLSSALVGTVWCLVQLLAALPWLAVLDRRAFRSAASRPANWAIALGVCVGIGAGLGLAVSIIQDPERVLLWGRVYGSVLHLQLLVDFFVILFPVLMKLWPHGAAVALAAFREGVRQPMYWLILAFALGLMVVSPFLPYFTFGEDFKMVRELGFDITMLAAVLFGVLAASMSITEEIEGRTAITVMSKPVSRREFLLGKYIGILLAALLMTGILGWVFGGIMWFEMWFDNQTVAPPEWLNPMRDNWAGTIPDSALDFSLGAGVWFDNVLANLPGLATGFCQASVLLAIAVALATRMPFIVTFVTCVVVFFLGHLTHVLVQVSDKSMPLVSFMAKFFDNVLPGLKYFNLGALMVRDVPPDSRLFGYYLGSVILYAIMYSIIALLFGLILFEDRDLA
jgi:ABC-type transport system involved in multi-copper enzyme maturation permease subunit